MTEASTDMSVLLVSDRIARWLEGQKNINKVVSKGHRAVAKDDKRYSRVSRWVVEGSPGRWQIEMFQANSRQYAHVVTLSFIEQNSAWPTPNVEWENKKIGDVSAGYHATGEEAAWEIVVFVRGNIAVKVSSEQADDRKYHDPRPIAAMIDSYLLDEPRTDDVAPRPAAIKLALRDAKETDKEPVVPATGIVGQPYMVTLSPAFRINKTDAPATQPANSTPASNSRVSIASEMRVRATHAEIVKRSDEAIQVTFLVAGKQEVNCYYIDHDGRVVAYGHLDIMVEKEPADSPHRDNEPRTSRSTTKAG